jgi:predicted MFS family arabinose efflux permease
MPHLPSNARSPRPMTIALWVMLVCGCLIGLISFGTRSSFGLFVDPISGPAGFDFGREAFAMALALQNLFWGIGQPIAGALSDKFGPWKVLAGGGVLFSLGLALMSIASDPTGFSLTAGILVGLGMSGAGHNTVLAAFGQLMPEERRPWAMGLVTSMASLGQFMVVPLGQAFIETYGWQVAILILAFAMATTPALALALRTSKKANQAPPPTTSTAGSFRESLSQAFGYSSFWLLLGGFFVCGFQLAFITVHFPPYLSDMGVSATVASWGLAMIGLFNIVGSYLSGPLSARWSRKILLSVIYFARAVVFVIFLWVPLSTVSVLCFGAAMGVLWLSTVPPTAQLVGVMFGNRYLAMLFGFVFLSHQIGAFFGVWLGGKIFALTGSYLPIWWGSVVLALIASLLHLPIRERLWVARLKMES